jgi:hypothetical protein
MGQQNGQNVQNYLKEDVVSNVEKDGLTYWILKWKKVIGLMKNKI